MINKTAIVCLLGFAVEGFVLNPARVLPVSKSIFNKSSLWVPQQHPHRIKASTLDENEKTVVILYHKPKGVITSHSNQDSYKVSTSDAHVRQTVYQDVMSVKGYIPTSNLDKASTSFQKVTGIHSKLHAVGRLDAETTGLLLLTNDGGLVHHVTNPTASSSTDQKIIKVYDALIMGHHTLEINDDSSEKLRQILGGVDIGKKYGGMTLPPHALQILEHPSSKSTLVRIAISEGRNRQVRRMFHAINSGVMQLHRRKVGNLDLDMLKHHNGDVGEEGSWRLLTKKEILHGLGWKVRPIAQAGRKEQLSHNQGKFFSDRKTSASKRRRRPLKTRR